MQNNDYTERKNSTSIRDAVYNYFDVYVDDNEMHQLLSSLEYMDEAHKELFLSNSSNNYPSEIDDKLTRALAYFVFRPCSEACDIEEFNSSLCFGVFCTKLIASLSKDNDIYEMARIVSEEIEYSEDNSEKIKFAYFN